MTTFTPPEVARRWRCKPDAVRGLLLAGLLKGFTISPPGTRRPHWRITLTAVEAYERGERPQQVPYSTRQNRRQLAIPDGPF